MHPVSYTYQPNSHPANHCYGYQGEFAEKDRETGFNHFEARLWDSRTGRWMIPDPAGQFHSPYLGMGNSPVVSVDPDGEIAWFIPMIVGAVIGGTSMGIYGTQTGEYSFIGGFWRGALVGGAAGTAAFAISAGGGGMFLSGMASGAIADGGFTGLKGGDVIQGIVSGGISGGVSGLLGAAIGGGTGAFFGNSVGSLIDYGIDNKTFKGGLGTSLLNGGVSWAMYHGMQYASWKNGGNKLGKHDVSYKQFARMNSDFQRSRFWKTERGGWLTNDGKVVSFKSKGGERHSYAVKGKPGVKSPKGAFATYHTHWAKPGINVTTDIDYDHICKEWHSIEYMQNEHPDVRSMRKITTTRYHSGMDYKNIDTFVINRYDASFSKAGTETHSILKDHFLRFHLPFKTIF